MAVVGFLNENANRAYPFLEGEVAPFPKSAVVACGFMLGATSGFDPAEHKVSLTLIQRVDDRFHFYFSTDAPGLDSVNLIFSRGLSEPQYTIEYSDTTSRWEGSVSAMYENDVCDVPDDFSGWIITGPLTDLAELIDSGEELAGNAPVEPALIQSLVHSYARSINVANMDRTRYTTPEGCREQCWTTEPEPHYTVAECLAGDIRFIGGYNCIVHQNIFDNALIFDAVAGVNSDNACEQIPAFSGEIPPEDSIFLEGGPACNETIRTINGLAGRIVSMAAGSGVTLTFTPDQNKITLDVDLRNLAICNPAEYVDIPEDCEEESPSEDPCDCGEEL